MSTGDRLLLILHIGFAIFAIGPITAATMATPRHIRRRDAEVVRHLNRNTRIYGLLTLAIFLFGLLLAHGNFSQVWLSASMTLFIVAFALLLIVERDQRKAVHKLELAAVKHRPEVVPAGPEPAGAGDDKASEATAGAESEAPADKPVAPAARLETDLAKVETGRIATISGVVALIWIVILVLMVWNA
jgi:Ca2+/Na+ antiporter